MCKCALWNLQLLDSVVTVFPVRIMDANKSLSSYQSAWTRPFASTPFSLSPIMLNSKANSL